jgi:cysteinyl-tRNA synthetase
MLRVFNSLSRQKEEFIPVVPGHVGMYVCGPTVYDYPHIGHAKVYISFDVIARYLRYLGNSVRYVQNITDVGHLTDDADEGEDKIERRAAVQRVQPMELAEYFTAEHFWALDALNCVRPNLSPRASAHIPEIIQACQALIERGHAYEADGNVYFDVSSFPGYGRLSNRRPEEQEAGARVEVAVEKRDPADFALWKKAGPGHIMRWPSPWGEGYPGWHIECSVMSMKYLGDTVDIHGGGLEHVFPHHEDEIAQSEALTGRQFVRYWLHNGMITVDGVKMSKSLGNFTTIREALEKHPAQLMRFFIASQHYRSSTNFSEVLLADNQRALERLYTALWNAERAQEEPRQEDEAASRDLEAAGAAARGRFLAAMNDDFNTPGAVASLFELATEVNRFTTGPGAGGREGMRQARAVFDELGGILGITWPGQPKMEEAEGLASELMEIITSLRQEARANRNWTMADQIRDKLKEAGILLEDHIQGGTTWRKA